jgi:hypothetical protein
MQHRVIATLLIAAMAAAATLCLLLDFNDSLAW